MIVLSMSKAAIYNSQSQLNGRLPIDINLVVFIVDHFKSELLYIQIAYDNSLVACTCRLKHITSLLQQIPYNKLVIQYVAGNSNRPFYTRINKIKTHIFYFYIKHECAWERMLTVRALRHPFLVDTWMLTAAHTSQMRC